MSEYLPLYYLHRGRYMEARRAAASLPPRTGSGMEAQATSMRRALMEEVDALLPEVQRRLVVTEPDPSHSSCVQVPHLRHASKPVI